MWKMRGEALFPLSFIWQPESVKFCLCFFIRIQTLFFCRIFRRFLFWFLFRFPSNFVIPRHAWPVLQKMLKLIQKIRFWGVRLQWCSKTPPSQILVWLCYGSTSRIQILENPVMRITATEWEPNISGVFHHFAGDIDQILHHTAQIWTRMNFWTVI